MREKLTDEAKEEGKLNSSSLISSDEEMEWLMTDDESETTEEPMEWEDVDEQDVIDQVQSIRTFKSDANANVLDVIEDNTPMNQSKESPEFFVILDTNILISNLDLVESIKGQYFKGLNFFLEFSGLLNFSSFFRYRKGCDLFTLHSSS